MTDNAKINAEIQKLSMDAVVVLFEIDATEVGGEIYRFTPSPFVPDPDAPAPQPVQWRGEMWGPVPMETSGWEVSGKGTLPAPVLKVSNVGLTFSGLAIRYGDFLGCPVIRHRTFARYLDGMPDADPEVEFDPDVFQIAQKTGQNKLFVEWKLGPAIDVQGRLLPGRSVLQGYCPLRYRRWDATAGEFDYSRATCPFTGDTNGGAMFDEHGSPVMDPALDRCAKRINIGCKLRFPTQALPFGGFPGVGRFSGS